MFVGNHRHLSVVTDKSTDKSTRLSVWCPPPPTNLGSPRLSVITDKATSFVGDHRFWTVGIADCNIVGSLTDHMIRPGFQVSDSGVAGCWFAGLQRCYWLSVANPSMRYGDLKITQYIMEGSNTYGSCTTFFYLDSVGVPVYSGQWESRTAI